MPTAAAWKMEVGIFLAGAERAFGVMTSLESVLSYGPRFERIEGCSGETSETPPRDRFCRPAWNSDRCDCGSHRKLDRFHLEMRRDYERTKPSVAQTMY